MNFKNLILFISALLLLCGIVVAERGSSLSQRRRASIGDRPVPSSSGDGDDNYSHDDYDDDSAGKGKSMKSEKSYGGKGTVGVEVEIEVGGEVGKGMKSGKSDKFGGFYKFGKGDSMFMSMDMELPDGKGTKMGKSAKSDKHKSEKNDKQSKKNSKSNGKLTLKPNMQPSPGPYTTPPTSIDSISSRSSPFAITYSPSTNTPTSENYAQLTGATQKYLEDFMMEFFDKTALTDLDNFLTIRVREAFIEGEPVLVTYESNGLFNPDSIFIPVTREIDNLIADALGSEDYLALIQSLPRSNPFRGTETTTLSTVDEVTTPSSRTGNGGGSSSYAGAGIAAAAAGFVVLAASLAVLKSRRGGLDDENESFSPQKLSSEDSTIAGETCNMSMDDSSGHFQTWRTTRTYNDTPEHEFEDEPLDSDDECEKMTAPASLS